MARHRDRSWVSVNEVEPLARPVTDNHVHLPLSGRPPSGPGSDAPRTAAELIEAAAQVGVTRLITSACEQPEWEPALELARAEPAVRVALALHPNEAPLHAGVRESGPDGLEPQVREYHELSLDEVLGQVAELARANRGLVVAIGESGLDFFRTGEAGRAVQRDAFRAHIALAKELDLPLQIHDREAHAECAEILLADGAPERTVFHCFSGDEALAQLCAREGWYASIAGPISYPANAELRTAVSRIPLDLLLLETDAPYLPPKAWRGRPNASYLMPATLRFLAQQRDCAESELAERIATNTETVYGSWGEEASGRRAQPATGA